MKNRILSLMSVMLLNFWYTSNVVFAKLLTPIDTVHELGPAIGPDRSTPMELLIKYKFHLLVLLILVAFFIVFLYLRFRKSDKTEQLEDENKN
ncbi:hypothetical protein ACFL21_00760 [Patescibacteria group bacterium]